MDAAARDLALLLRSRHPLVVCETVEEQRFETLVRAVSSELTLTPAGARLLSRLVMKDYRGIAELRRTVPRPTSFRISLSGKETPHG